MLLLAFLVWFMDGWMDGGIGFIWGFWRGGGEEFPLSSIFVQMVHISSRLSFGSVCRDLVLLLFARKSFIFSNNSLSDLGLSLYIHLHQGIESRCSILNHGCTYVVYICCVYHWAGVHSDVRKEEAQCKDAEFNLRRESRNFSPLNEVHLTTSSSIHDTMLTNIQP
jgi:hypothetical protein